MQSGLEFRNFLSRRPHLSRKGLSFVPDDGPHSPLCRGSQNLICAVAYSVIAGFAPPPRSLAPFILSGPISPFRSMTPRCFFPNIRRYFFFAKRVPFRPSEFSSKKGRDFNPSWRPLLRGLCQKTFPSSVRLGWIPQRPEKYK